MTSPLLPLVSLRYTGSPVPTAGLYLNDLPGISITAIDAIANTEQATFLHVWETVQTRASQLFTTAFVNAVSKRYRLRRVPSSAAISSAIDTSITYPAATQYRGFTIAAPQAYSPLLLLYLDSLSLYLSQAVNTTIKVYQVVNNNLTQIDSIAITGLVGWNQIALNKSYPADKTLFVGYDASAIIAVSLNPSPTLSIAGSTATVQGAYYDGSTFATGSETYGLSGSISLQCSFEPLMALLKNQIAVAYWYLLGAELMAERIYTDRINRYTTIDLPKARALREEFKQNFTAQLMTVVEGLDLNEDSCIDCYAQLLSREQLP